MLKLAEQGRQRHDATSGTGSGAAVGDAVARILSFAGYEVTREYYVNDVGNQMNNLGRATYLRYLELHGRDKLTGEILGSVELPAPGQYGMMTYMHDGKQYVVVAIGGNGREAEWVAFALR